MGENDSVHSNSHKLYDENAEVSLTNSTNHSHSQPLPEPCPEDMQNEEDVSEYSDSDSESVMKINKVLLGYKEVTNTRVNRQTKTRSLFPICFAHMQNGFEGINVNSETLPPKTIFKFIPIEMDYTTFRNIFYPHYSGVFNINETNAYHGSISFDQQEFKTINDVVRPFHLCDQVINVYSAKMNKQMKDIPQNILLSFENETTDVHSLFHIKGNTESITWDKIIHRLINSHLIKSSSDKKDFIVERLQLRCTFYSKILNITFELQFNYDVTIPGYKYCIN